MVTVNVVLLNKTRILKHVAFTWYFQKILSGCFIT